MDLNGNKLKTEGLKEVKEVINGKIFTASFIL